jgi:phosphatidate cytidylyltransferase
LPRWDDLRTRALAAALLVPLTLGALLAGGWFWAAFVLLGLAILCWEWARLCGGSVLTWPGMALPAAVLPAALLGALGWPLAGLLLALLGVALAVLGARRAAGPVPAAWLGFGALWIGLGGLALLWLRLAPEGGVAAALFLLLVVWASDIGAYAAGRRFGGPKLWPAVSPNKTWAGAAGGLLAATLVGLVAAAAFTGGWPGGAAALTAAGLGVCAQAGDLLESWLKRRFGVKDSSHLIPGHGGLLDRLDGVLAAAPVAALLGVLAAPGAPLWRFASLGAP